MRSEEERAMLQDFDKYENILAYRMSVLETSVSGIDKQLDQLITNLGLIYPTREMLELTIAPLRKEIEELKTAVTTKEAERRQLANQMKVMVIGVVSSPIVAALVAAFVSGMAR